MVLNEEPTVSLIQGGQSTWSGSPPFCSDPPRPAPPGVMPTEPSLTKKGKKLVGPLTVNSGGKQGGLWVMSSADPVSVNNKDN